MSTSSLMVEVCQKGVTFRTSIKSIPWDSSLSSLFSPEEMSAMRSISKLCSLGDAFVVDLIRRHTVMCLLSEYSLLRVTIGRDTITSEFR